MIYPYEKGMILNWWLNGYSIVFSHLSFTLMILGLSSFSEDLQSLDRDYRNLGKIK